MSKTEIREKKSNAGSYYLIGIGLAVALVGAVFVWLMWRSHSRTMDTFKWEKTPCLMIVSEMETRSAKHISKEYKWNLAYTYIYEGKSYTSKFDRPRPKWTSAKAEIENQIKAYPVGKNTFCYVNPENKKAILHHDSKAVIYSIWFPGLFVVGGLGVMVGALRGISKNNKVNRANAESA